MMRRPALILSLYSILIFSIGCQGSTVKPAYPTGRIGEPPIPLKAEMRERGVETPSAAIAVPVEAAVPVQPHSRPVEDEPPRIIAQAAREEGPPPEEESPETEAEVKEAPKERKGEERKFVALNFDNADLYDFIHSISEITGINYVIAPGVGGKITVHTAGNIPSGEVIHLMDTILEVYGLAAVKSGDLYKVVPIQQAKGLGSEIGVGRMSADVAPEERVMVQVVKLNYLPPAVAMEGLRAFLTPHGEMVPIPTINVLIIIDSASSVRRLLDLVGLFDVDIFKNMGIKLYPVQHVAPTDLANEMKAIFAAIGLRELSAGGGLEAIPFDRLNSILLLASTPSLLQSAEGWLKELDRAAEEVGIQTYVYYVENGKASNIAEILNRLYISGEKGPAPPSLPAQRVTPPPPVGGRPEQGPPPPQTPAPETPRLPGLITGEVKIVADEATNALIVQATPYDYRIIEKTIQELDLRPKQVLVEVLIAEVTLTKGLDFGVQWTVSHANKSGSTVGVGKSLFRTPGQGITDLEDLRDFFSSLASLTPGLTYSLTSGEEIFLLLNALATVTDVDILSSPHILTSDNKEARINVGDEVPIVTSEQLPVGVELTRFRNIQYRQTGVTLTVTPHINSKNLVTMDIVQEVSEVAAGGIAAVQAETPTISTRNAKTTVVVQDGQTILLGGLISRNRQKVESKVPFLGDVPLMGNLFKTTTDRYRRRELILLITPRVVSTDEEAGKLTTEFMERIESLRSRMEDVKKGKGE